MPGNTKQRKRKHRGTQGGGIDKRGRTSPKNRKEAMNRARNQKVDRRLKPPSWNGAIKRGVLFAVLLFPLSTLVFGQPVGGALVLTVIAAFFYVPLGYYTDSFFYRRRMAQEARARQAKKEARGD